MTRLILYRLLISIPLLFAVSITAFMLKDIMQSDDALRSWQEQNAPVRRNIEPHSVSGPGDNLPLFYFSIRPLAYPDTLFKTGHNVQSQRIKKFIHQGIPWAEVRTYLQLEQTFINAPAIKSGQLLVEPLLMSYTPSDLLSNLNGLPDSIRIRPEVQAMRIKAEGMSRSAHYLPLFVPTLKWHGTTNGYHQWLTGILKGNWGNSRVDYRPSWIKIKEAIGWTLSINLISLVLVFGLAILLGEWLFLHRLKTRGKLVEAILFFMYSIPRFFLAMILIQFFASDTVHPGLHIFPSPGFFDSDPTASVFRQWIRYGSQLILPVISMVLPSMAYLTRVYSGKLLDERSKPYAFLAWSKGDTPGFITRKHLRLNALMPLIALLGLEIPALIGGSVVIEVLFNLPGMGRLMLQSIVMQDWVIVFNILLLTGVFTILGKLISDILYSFLDPRVRWTGR